MGCERGGNVVFIAAAAVALVAGCGDAVVEGSYQGRPQLLLEARIESLEPLRSAAPVKVGIAWFLNQTQTMVEVVGDLKVTGLDRRLQLARYEPPDRFLLGTRPVKNQQSAGIAVGFIQIFQDNNENDVFDAADAVLGESEGVITFANIPYGSAKSAALERIGLSVQLGYSVAQPDCAGSTVVSFQLLAPAAIMPILALSQTRVQAEANMACDVRSTPALILSLP